MKEKRKRPNNQRKLFTWEEMSTSLTANILEKIFSLLQVQEKSLADKIFYFLKFHTINKS